MKNGQCKARIDALIEGLPVISQMSGQAWEEALAASSIVCEPAGMNLVPNPENSDHLALILKGSIKVRALASDGRVFNMLHVKAGEMCLLSLAGMFGTHNLGSDVITEEDTLLLRIPRRHVDRLMAESTEFRNYLMTSMSSCFVKMLDLIEEVAFERLQCRIVNHLRSRCKAVGGEGKLLTVTHQELACELGSTREVVSRLLKALERDGKIKLRRGRITLLVPDMTPDRIRSKATARALNGGAALNTAPLAQL